jgi:hypothetical protein
VFASFFFAGFECTTGYNRHGRWIDQIAATQHDRFAAEDYARLREVGIRTVREAVRWPLVDRAGRYDFASLGPFVEALRSQPMEPIWDLFHFGHPDDADLLSEGFAERFADYCYAVARHLARETDGPLWFTPVNEPSYLAWAAGEAALFPPYLEGAGPPLKRALARAALRGTEALRSACPQAGIVSVDAICRVVAPCDRPELEPEARHFNEAVVFESLDMLAGRLHPELGGSRAHLGVIGLNYYWTNQWELGGAAPTLAEDDPRRVPVRALVEAAWRRYGGDVAITETAHVGDARGAWLRAVAGEAEALLDAGVPLRGVCLYPVLGMPEWHAPDQWTRMGLWDLVPQSPTLARVAHAPALAALREVQGRLARRARS